jgi:catechol 2,3-dioxygenase-like lactoylglutathione lyase family enzyme
MTGGRVSFRGKALTIACTNLQQSVHFYENLLGAVVLPEDGYGCPWYRLGSFVFTLLPNAAERSPASFPTHAMAMLWLEVEDLEAARGRLTQFGVKIIQPPDGQSMLIADPDGLVIEVWQSEAESGRDSP